MILGVDVSSCQGHKLDLVRARDEGGVRFVIQKITEGLTGVDPTGMEHVAAARAAGLPFGAYHFARVSQGHPAAQVAKLWEACGGTMPNLPVALDLESAPDGMAAQEIVDFARAFADETQRWFGRLPLFYSYPAFMQRLQPALGASDLARCPLWIAHYLWLKDGLPPASVHPSVGAPWTAWTIWQFSADHGARVPGIPTDVDRNAFAGDEMAFRAFCGLSDVDSDPTIRVLHPPAFPDDDDPPPRAA